MLLSAAVALSACASKGEPAAAAEHETGRPAPQVEHRAAAQPASGTICRSIGSVAGKGKNDAYMCKASAVLNSAEAREVLDPSIRVSYGSTGSSTNVSRQSAFLNAVKRFQSTAQRRNKRAIRLVSFYDRQVKGGNEYECHVGTFHSYVVLKGSYH